MTRPVEHDAEPRDGHQYRLTFHSGKVLEPMVALASYSGASVVFSPPGFAAWSAQAVSELDPDLERVDRVTDTPAPPLGRGLDRFARPDQDEAA